jgi:hypothetical protein
VSGVVGRADDSVVPTDGRVQLARSSTLDSVASDIGAGAAGWQAGDLVGRSETGVGVGEGSDCG